MGWIAWIFFGLVAGALAKAIVPGRDPGGWIITMLLGIGGAVVGGWIGNLLWGSTGVNGFNISSLFLAIFGAVVLLVIYHAIKGRGDKATASEDETTRRAA